MHTLVFPGTGILRGIFTTIERNPRQVREFGRVVIERFDGEQGERNSHSFDVFGKHFCKRLLVEMQERVLV